MINNFNLLYFIILSAIKWLNLFYFNNAFTIFIDFTRFKLKTILINLKSLPKLQAFCQISVRYNIIRVHLIVQIWKSFIRKFLLHLLINNLNSFRSKAAFYIVTTLMYIFFWKRWMIKILNNFRMLKSL